VPTRRKRVFLWGGGTEREGKEDKDAMLGIAVDEPASFNSFSSASKFKKVESIYNPVVPSL
jgi:hypothetical protein